MSQQQHKTPDWLLERIALGELPETELRAARDRLKSEPDGLQRLQAIEHSNQQMLEDYPARSVVAGIRERQKLAGAKSRPLWSRLAIASPIAAAAALVLWLGLPADPGIANPDIEITHSKGLQTHLLIYRQQKADQAPQQLFDQDKAAQGDLLQLAYQIVPDEKSAPNPKSFGAIFSFDGRGQWTRHLPAQEQQAKQSPALKIGKKVPLRQAYSLDDAPDFECFYLLSARQPFALDQALQQLRHNINLHNAGRPQSKKLEIKGQSIDLFSRCISKTKKL